MEEKKALEPTEPELSVVVRDTGQYQLSVDGVVEQVKAVQDLMSRVMTKDIHYGVIPGTGTKPTLLKPGAELLCTLFRFAPELQVTRDDLDGGHREYEIKCCLRHIPSGHIVAEGVGTASTMEKKYRWRQGKRRCPECNQESIIIGKEEYGGGFVCWKNKGGCGAKFAEDEPSIVNQEVGRIENPDIADQYNTVKKMAKKRALIDAVLTATGASSLFTQDIEDMVPHQENDNVAEEPKEEKKRGRPPSTKATADQIKLIKTVISKKSKETGIKMEDISQEVYSKMNITSSKELNKTQVDEALKIIDAIPAPPEAPPF